MTDDSTPSFLNRWSRLKRHVSLEREATAKPGIAVESSSRLPPGGGSETGDAAPSTGDPAETPAPTSVGKEDEVDLSKLPPIDSLGRDSDYSVFMRQGIPDELRKKALRRMWLTDPSIAGPDLLEMNALDYTGLEGPRPLPPYGTQILAATAKAVREHLGKAADDAAAPAGEQESQSSEGSEAPTPAPAGPRPGKEDPQIS